MRQGNRSIFFATLCVLFVFCLFLQGCASRFEKALEEVHTADDAVLRFGAPTTVTELPGGQERREWIIDRNVNVPGQFVDREYYLGRDSDGYPVYVTRRMWVPEHMQYYDCTLIVVSDERGVVLDRRWRGNSCGALLFHSLPPAAKASTGSAPSATPPKAPPAPGSATVSGGPEKTGPKK